MNFNYIFSVNNDNLFKNLLHNTINFPCLHYWMKLKYILINVKHYLTHARCKFEVYGIISLKLQKYI